MTTQQTMTLVGECSRNVLGRQPTEADRQLAGSLVAALWSDAKLADDFVSGKKGWEKALSTALSVGINDVRNIVGRIGRDSILQTVAEHPTGLPPSRIKTPTGPAIVHAMPQSTACQTYGCQTYGCQTSGCQTYGCSSNHCINFDMK